MHSTGTEHMARMSGPIHRLPTVEKLILALAIVVFIVALPARWCWLLALVAGLLLITVWLSRASWRVLTLRLLAMEPLVLCVSALALFGPGGWRAFVLLVARCTLCLLTMLLLANATPMTELLGVLRRWRVPSLLIVTLALMHRYQFVLVDEAVRMRRARASRTLMTRRSLASRGLEWRAGASTIAHLFIRSTERAERIYAAMCARGWR